MGSLRREDLREELQLAESSLRSALVELRGWVKEDVHAEIQAAWSQSRGEATIQTWKSRANLPNEAQAVLTTSPTYQVLQPSTNSNWSPYTSEADAMGVQPRSRNSYKSSINSWQTKTPAQLSRSFSLNHAATFGRPSGGSMGLILQKVAEKRQSMDDLSSVPVIQAEDAGKSAPTSSWSLAMAEPVRGNSALRNSAAKSRLSVDANVRFSSVDSNQQMSRAINGSGSLRTFKRVPRARSLLDEEDDDSPEVAVLLEKGERNSRGDMRASKLKRMIDVSTYQPSLRHSNLTPGSCVAGLEAIVLNPYFETIVGLLVALNAVVIGFAIDAEARDETNPWVDAAGPFFAIIFTLELIARWAVVGGKEYLCGDQCHWNLFDLTMVGLQLFDEGSTLVKEWMKRGKAKSSLGIFRILRIVRLIRVTRLIRLVHLFADLKSMVSSMINSVGALFWAMVLLFMIIYMFSVLCMAIILESESVMDSHLEYYFGSMPRTALTLFECVVGGVNWDEVVMLLCIKISPYMGLIFCMYLTVSLFAVTNLVTGVFVDKAMQMTREDKDTYLANRISHLFFTGEDDAEEVTWETFQQKLTSEAMQEYFKVLNLDVAEARGLFDLLDTDHSGAVTTFEVVSGCLRLRGPAKALDLALLAQDTSRIEEMMQELCNYLEYRSPAG